MNLLNLACGNVRPPSTESVRWRHVDNLLPVLGRHSQEWKNLQLEPDYLEHDVTEKKLPFQDEFFDGIMCSHFLEHVDCQMAVRIMRECRRVLKPGGVLLVSVPDASYFRKVHAEDTVENAERLFGEPIHLPDGETTFFGYGLWNRWHKAILTEDALWAYFVRSGFDDAFWPASPEMLRSDLAFEAFVNMTPLLNRREFSLVRVGVKG